MTSVAKVTINIPVDDAQESFDLLSSLVECELVIGDGARYALVNLGGVRIAFVSGSEDISHGRVALALEVSNASSVSDDAKQLGLSVCTADHASDRAFFVTDLPGSADLIYYEK